MTELRASNGITKFSRLDIEYLVLIFATLIYITIWSYLSIYRIITFQAGTFDLGLFSQELYLVFHSSGYELFITFLNRDPAILFSWLYLFHSLFVIVIVQTIFLAISSLLIYQIAKIVTGSKKSALLFGLIFLINPVMYGVNWFDVHNQAFFIFFFPLAFYLFLKKRYGLSTIFFLISGMVHYLYLIFPILFSLVIITESIMKNKHELSKDKEFFWVLIIFILSSLLLAISYYLNILDNITPLSTIHTSIDPSYYLNLKFLVILITLAPLGFLSIYPNKYAILQLPYFVLVFISSSYYYFFPGVLLYQYTAMLIPGLYISAIYSYNKIVKKIKKQQSVHKVKAHRIVYHRLAVTRKYKLPLIIIILTLLLALSYAPYGPLNQENPLFDTTLSESHYIVLYQEFNKLISFIPKNDPYILFGDNEPELTPLPQIQNAPLLVTPYTINGNFSYQSILNGSFVKANVQYVVGNPYGMMFTNGYNNTYNLSMFQAINRLYSSEHYGILAEASGMILLERNYTGPLIYYVPLNLNLTDSYLFASYVYGYVPYGISNGLEFFGTRPLVVFNLNHFPIISSETSLNGPMFLPPGEYEINMLYDVLNASENSSISLTLETNNGSEIKGEAFHVNSSKIQTIEIHFNSKSMLGNLHFVLNPRNISIRIISIHVSQLSPEANYVNTNLSEYYNYLSNTNFAISVDINCYIRK